MKNLGVISVLLPTLVLASLSAGEAQVRPLVFVDDIADSPPVNRPTPREGLDYLDVLDVSRVCR